MSDVEEASEFKLDLELDCIGKEERLLSPDCVRADDCIAMLTSGDTRLFRPKTLVAPAGGVTSLRIAAN